MIPISQRKLKVTYVLTHHIRWLPFELVATLIDKTRFDVDYVILGLNDPIIEFLRRSDIPCISYDFSDYSGTPEAVKFVYDHLIRTKSDIVQTHWFAGSLVGIQAAYYANVPVRIFHREHPPLRYYSRHPLSKHKLIWDCATHIVAVTTKSKLGMMEDGISADKISVIPTGFDVEEFQDVNPARVALLRDKYLGSEAHSGRYPVIGVAARYVKWKGVEYVIDAFLKILEHYPDALLVLSGTHIDRTTLADRIKTATSQDIVAPLYLEAASIIERTSQLPADSFIEIPFEDDLHALFRLFDVFVHAPTDDVQETFGQVYVEAMLSKVPSVVTLSGSALDHAVHRETAWVVDYKQADQIAAGILALLDDSDLRQSIVQKAYSCACERYSIAGHIKTLENLYSTLWQSATARSEPDS